MPFMDYIQYMTRAQANPAAVKTVLDQSLPDRDILRRESRERLARLELAPDTALALLAAHLSKTKYRYEIAQTSLEHILNLAGRADEPGDHGALRRVIEAPIRLVKACWLYEHAPFFLLFGQNDPEKLDAFLIEYGRRYEQQYMLSTVNMDDWRPLEDPRRVRATTFWERQIWDPVLMIDRARRENLQGIEICVDFHPFNFAKLLPEEITTEKRQQIREALQRSGVKLDIHSPIIGPYLPVPSPAKGGAQSFFDPTQCMEVQFETVDLAVDVGAESVVFHLVDTDRVKPFTQLVQRAQGSRLHVTVENYCQGRYPQTSECLLKYVEKAMEALPADLRRANFGITLDVGHLNIDGEDPLVGCEKVGRWCLANHVFMRMHATDNYGNLLFSPPAFSADVHSNVSGRGINNAVIIRLLRHMGHELPVVAEQIQPLTDDDIQTIHDAQSAVFTESFEDVCRRGEEALLHLTPGAFIEKRFTVARAYQYLAGMKGVPALTEHLIFRTIQDRKNLSVDEAKRISLDFMRMPQHLRADLTRYVDDLLLPIHTEAGVISKSDVDVICQNISGAVFATINNEHMKLIFREDRVYMAGDVICDQAHIGTEMYYVKDGEAHVRLNGSLMATLRPGEIFGEMSLFYSIRRSATVTAAMDGTRVGVLTRTALETLFKSGQPFAHDLIYRLYTLLPDRLRNLNDKYKATIRFLSLLEEGDQDRLHDFDKVGAELVAGEVDFLPTLVAEDTRELHREVRDVGAEQVIFSEGDDADGAYFLISGHVRVVCGGPDPCAVTLGELHDGEIFGEMALIDDKPRSATVVTLAPCRLAFLNHANFDQLIQSKSALAFRLMGFICLSLFRRILTLDKLYCDIKQRIKDAREGKQETGNSA